MLHQHNHYSSIYSWHGNTIISVMEVFVEASTISLIQRTQNIYYPFFSACKKILN